MKSKKAIFLFLSLTFCIICFPFSVTAIESSIPLDQSYYFIRNVNSGLYMDVANGSSESGANIWQCGLNGTDAQIFKLKRANYGASATNTYYELLPKVNETLRVDVSNASDTNGANIGTFYENPPYASAQQFRFIFNSDGSCRIMPRLSSNKVIEVQNSSLDNLANVQIWEYDGLPTQHWALELVKLSNGWNYSDYSYGGSYTPKKGSFFAKRESVWETALGTYSYFTFDSHNITNIQEYMNGNKNGSNCYLTIDVRHNPVGALALDTVSAIYMSTSLPNPKFDIENDDPLGTSNEESEVVALSIPSASVTYFVHTAWSDLRYSNTSNNGNIAIQFGMSKKGVFDYNTVIQATGPQASISLDGGLNGGDP